MNAPQILPCYACNAKNLFLLFFLILISHYSYSQQVRPKAFPTAEGFGKYATGGRGGAVIKVTNLNDSGPGSLRQALQYTSGPRTIIFEVGGTITLKSVLPIISGNVTIAGQTAPGGGILIKDGHLLVQSSNVIIRHLRFRYGEKPSKYDDSLSITAWNKDIVENIVIDHCSISWGRDENFEIRVVTEGTCRNITIQNTIISEGLYGALLYGPRVYDISFYENLFAHNMERNLRSNYPSDDKFDFEMVNNIIYGVRVSTAPSMGSKFAVINNIYRQSNDFLDSRTAVSAPSANYRATDADTDAYIEGNLLLNGYAKNSSNLNPYLKAKPFGSSGIIARPANQIEDILLDVGASLPQRDAVDKRILKQYENGNGTIKYSGTYPTIQGGKAKVDTDNDGMPDDWELANGLNPNDPSDRNIVQPDGYTNLEYYLNGMSLKTTSIKANAGDNVSICLGKSTNLTATGGATYLWNTGAKTASITVSPDKTTTYTVTAYDSTGNNSDTDDVTVTVNSLPEVSAGSDVTIKVGDKTTLTATGADSYLWSTGETSRSIEVSPTSTTVYTVIGKINACEASDSVTVFSIDASVKANAGKDVEICATSSATLTATGGSSYLWSTGAKTASITVSPKETSTYTVTAFDSTGKNSDKDDVTVIVNPLPKVNAGNNITINSGESTTLVATGATSYKWSTGETSASINVSPTATKTYTVTGIRNGCEATDTVRVTVVNPVGITANAGADQTICTGTSATLTATGGSSYLWNTGAKTASITVSPKETSTYTVTAFDSSGKNSDKDEVKVTVNPLPSVDAGSNRTIDSGQTVTLTASGATTYKWSTGATGPSITVSPTATQTYSVTGSKNGCEATATVKVTVKEPVVVVARAGGNQDVCEGGEVTLTATGGERYLWSTGATTASIKVNPKTTTKYSVTAYVGDFSGTDEAIVKVSPKPKVVIVNGSEATVLEGEFITLSAKGANSYKWSNGATQPNIAVRPTKTKTYDVVGYVNDCSSERSIKVNVYEKVVANAGDDVAICSNETTVLTAKGPENSKFLWSTGETTKSITVSPDEDTEYSVMVYHDLDSDTDSVMVNVRNCVNSQVIGDSVTIEDTEALDFLIHPNPTDGEVHIKISGLSNESSIHLYDLSGKSLYHEAISVNGRQSYNKTLDLSEFASGIYLLQLINDQKVITKKIVLR